MTAKALSNPVYKLSEFDIVDSVQDYVVTSRKSENKLRALNDYLPITENSKIYNGDCIAGMKSLKNHSVDMILTDPPYNLGKFMHKRGTNLKKMRDNHFAYSGWDDLDNAEWIENMNDFFEQCNRVLKKRATLFMFMSLMKVESLVKIAEKHKFYYKTVGVWHKTNPMPRNMNLQFVNSTECWIYFINEGTTGTFNNEGKVIHDFVESSLTTGNEKKFGKHPTQKPISIVNYFIKLLSNEGDVVLDSFMGSGSTGVSCELLKRKFIGIELNDEYFNIAKNRIKNISL